FFLDGIDDVKTEWQFLPVLAKPTGDLCDHKPTHPVVKRPTDEPSFVQLHQFILEGDDAADMNAHRVDLLLVFCTHIDKYILQRRGFFLRHIAHMYRRPTENSFYNPLVSVNVHALARCDLMVRPPVAPYVDVAVIGYVIHEPGDFIGVSLYHYFITRLGIDHADHGTISIDRVVLDVGFEILQPDLLTGRFKTGR